MPCRRPIVDGAGVAEATWRRSVDLLAPSGASRAVRCRLGLRKRREHQIGADEDLNGFQTEDARYQAQPP
jgi:hypothetical protein